MHYCKINSEWITDLYVKLNYNVTRGKHGKKIFETHSAVRNS